MASETTITCGESLPPLAISRGATLLLLFQNFFSGDLPMGKIRGNCRLIFEVEAVRRRYRRIGLRRHLRRGDLFIIRRDCRRERWVSDRSIWTKKAPSFGFHVKQSLKGSGRRKVRISYNIDPYIFLYHLKVAQH